MVDHLQVLEGAISDTGSWRWWDGSLPKLFQVEFGRVQLLNPPLKPGAPPSGILALRFDRPITAAFVTRVDAPANFNVEWPRLLHADKLQPFGVDYDAFSLTDVELFRRVLGEARRVETIHGPEPTAEALAGAPARLAFFAGPVGFVIAADALVALSHDGELSPSEILERSRQWWLYWKDYWKRKHGADALPYDATCEVTIPLAKE